MLVYEPEPAVRYEVVSEERPEPPVSAPVPDTVTEPASGPVVGAVRATVGAVVSRRTVWPVTTDPALPSWSTETYLSAYEPWVVRLIVAVEPAVQVVEPPVV